MGLATTIDLWSERARGLALAGLERLTTGVIFNPLAPGFREDPYPFYRRLRETDPFHRSYPASGWVLSRYEDVLAVLRDPRFGADERTLARFPRIAAMLRRAGLPNP